MPHNLLASPFPLPNPCPPPPPPSLPGRADNSFRFSFTPTTAGPVLLLGIPGNPPRPLGILLPDPKRLPLTHGSPKQEHWWPKESLSLLGQRTRLRNAARGFRAFCMPFHPISLSGEGVLGTQMPQAGNKHSVACDKLPPCPQTTHSHAQQMTHGAKEARLQKQVDILELVTTDIPENMLHEKP